MDVKEQPGRTSHETLPLRRPWQSALNTDLTTCSLVRSAACCCIMLSSLILPSTACCMSWFMVFLCSNAV